MVESKGIKVKKVLHIICDCFVISVTFLIVYLCCVDSITIKEIIRQIFPITFETNWFIGCYLLLYIIHPFLNKIIQSTDKEKLLRINVFLIILYCVIDLVLWNGYYYNKLIGFIVVYFIVAYVKLYLKEFSENKKINISLLFFGIFMSIAILVVTNILGLNIDLFYDKMLHWNGINNIFYIMIALALLNLFSHKSFYNKPINYISSLSLLFYVIHENEMFRTYTKPLFYQYVFQFGNKVMWVIIEAVLLIIFGVICSIIYKETLQKLVHRISDKLLDILSQIWNKVEYVMLKLN